MSRSRFRRTVRQAVRGSALALASSALLSFSASASPQGRIALTGSISPAVHSAKALGSVASNEQVSFEFTLPLRDQAGLADLLKGLYDPSDSRFHQFLTPQEFQARFAPTQADYDAVIAYAKSQGLTVTGTHSNRTLLNVSGSVSVVNAALGVSMQNFQAADGHVFHAPAQEPSVPSAIAHIVSSVVGLDNAALAHPYSKRVSTPSALSPATILNPSVVHAGQFAPTDIKTMFNIPTITSPGSGQVLGLFELDGYLASDITTWESRYQSSATAPLSIVSVDGGISTLGGGQDEVTLDIDMMLALAPKASQIIVYEAPNGSGILDCYDRIASDNQATSVSSSWGLAENLQSSGFRSAENTAFTQMATQGQSMYVASGDSGAYADNSAISVQDPGSQPEIVAVGGTDIYLNNDGSWNHETSWGDVTDTNNGHAKGSGSGGGISTDWTIPSYQNGFITGTNSTSTTMRNVPDVSLYGDYDTGGYIVTINGTDFLLNGTSAAAPLWAGFNALVNQERAANGSSVLGFPNPTLYALAATSAYSTDFRDTTLLDNLFYSAGTGYDLATGLGTFDGTTLLADLVPPAAPVAALQSTTSSTITLSWPTVTKATGYNVYRATTPGTTGLTKIASNVSTTSYADSTVSSGTTYYYHATSLDIAGESGYSNQVTASLTPAAATHFVVSAPSAATAGTPITFTVTAEDSTNNTATGYTGTVHFTTSDRYGSVPANATLTNGTGTFSATLGTSGTQTVTATDTVTSSITGTSGGISVLHGSATLLGIRVRSTTVAGGVPTTINVYAYDIYGNQVINYSGKVHFTSSDGSAVLPADIALNGGQGSVRATLFASGSQTITATDTVTSSINATQTFTVTNNPAVRFRIGAAPGSVTAGTPVTVTIIAQDAAGNTARGYTGTVHFTATDPQATLPADATLTNGQGTFSATFKTVGRYTVTATDTVTGSITGTSGSVNVSAGAATHLKATAQSTAVAGKAFGVVVQALDAYGNVATAYTGTVHISSTDASATLPADGVLYSGQRTFLATLRTVGGQTVTTTDTVTSSLTATTGTVTITAH